MVLLKDIDAHFSAMLSKFGIEEPMHQNFYLQKIRPLIAKEIRKGLAHINFISEESCDDFFNSFKTIHQELFKQTHELMVPLVEKIKQGQSSKEIEAQISLHINNYLSNIKNSIETLTKRQIASCAQSLSGGLELFNKKSQDQRWQMLNPALKKQLKMYSEQFKKLNCSLKSLLAKNISHEPVLSEFKAIYEQTLNLMYSCRQEVSHARNKSTAPAEKPLIEQLRLIIQMIWKRLCSLFSEKVTEIFADKQHSHHDVMSFSQYSSSIGQGPQHNMRH